MSTEIPLCFVHVPKCSGTSVTSLFRGLYGARAFDGLTTLDYARLKTEDVKSFAYFGGHNYHRDRLRLPAGTLFFSVFREPTARVISLKQYWGFSVEIDSFADADDNMREAMQIARSASIFEFLASSNPFIKQEITNGLIRQVVPLEVLYERSGPTMISRFGDEVRSYHSVLTMDRIRESLPLMLIKLGITEAPALGRENPSQKSQDAFSFDEVRDRLYEISPLDFAAYEIAKAIENEQISCRTGL